MLSLTLGLIAALCWGVHDVCVRFAATRCGPATAFLCVLAIGALALVPLMFLPGQDGELSANSLLLAVISGFCYAIGGYSLYRAFEIGPVRLVAPVVGAYPVLSVLWATVQGTPPSLPQFGAVAAIVAGVGLNAVLSDGHEQESGQDGADRVRRALSWSLAASVGFALTFAFGQAASAGGGGLVLIFVPRITAFAVLLSATMVLDRKAIDLKSAPIGLLLLMGCCDAAALGLVLWSGTLPRPEFAAVAASTFGMITIILAALFLKERMTPPQWGAVALVFSGIGYLAL